MNKLWQIKVKSLWQIKVKGDTGRGSEYHAADPSTSQARDLQGLFRDTPSSVERLLLFGGGMGIRGWEGRGNRGLRKVGIRWYQGGAKGAGRMSGVLTNQPTNQR